MAINLPDLPYDYDALQPVISAATMKLHHRGCVDNAYVEGAVDSLLNWEFAERNLA